MPQKIFVNLPVKYLDKTVEFFTKLGFGFNHKFTDDNAACMIVADDIFVMLLVEKFFKGFTKKKISDAKKSTEVLLALSVESRVKVDETLKAALDAGGKRQGSRRSMAGCTAAASRTSTAISGKSSGWTKARRRSSEFAELLGIACLLHFFNQIFCSPVLDPSVFEVPVVAPQVTS